MSSICSTPQPRRSWTREVRAHVPRGTRSKRPQTVVRPAVTRDGVKVHQVPLFTCCLLQLTSCKNIHYDDDGDHGHHHYYNKWWTVDLSIMVILLFTLILKVSVDIKFTYEFFSLSLLSLWERVCVCVCVCVLCVGVLLACLSQMPSDIQVFFGVLLICKFVIWIHMHFTLVMTVNCDFVFLFFCVCFFFHVMGYGPQ